MVGSNRTGSQQPLPPAPRLSPDLRFPEQRFDFRKMRHRRGGARPRHRNAGRRAGEAHGRFRLQSARQRRREGPVEGIASAGRLHHGAGIESRDEDGAFPGVQERAFFAERDEGRAGALGEEDVARPSGVDSFSKAALLKRAELYLCGVVAESICCQML